MISNVFGSQLNKEMLNFMKILADKDRLSLITGIAEAFKALLNDKNNILEGVAITAVPMESEELEGLQAKLSTKYNKTVILKMK